MLEALRQVHRAVNLRPATETSTCCCGCKWILASANRRIQREVVSTDIGNPDREPGASYRSGAEAVFERLYTSF